MIGRITRALLSEGTLKGNHILALSDDSLASDTDIDLLQSYCAIIFPKTISPILSESILNSGCIAIPVDDSTQFLDGEVVRIDSQTQRVSSLYKRESNDNALFVTGKCSHKCLMCSQPPTPTDDLSLFQENLQVLDLLPDDTPDLCITGGEPSLLRENLVELVHECAKKLPDIFLQILTHGAAFQDKRFAELLVENAPPNLLMSIPLYSCYADEHDYIVQTEGAFEETLLGIYNLASFGTQIEIRVVIIEPNHRSLPNLGEFIFRNFPFVSHVALMGLEPIGYARTHSSEVWIDPSDYQKELMEAVDSMYIRGLPISIFNHQLCVLPPELWRFSAKSISDWKCRYLPDCEDCVVRDKCGGFFESAIPKWHSRGIQKVIKAELEDAF